MNRTRNIELQVKRKVEATLIPSGMKIFLEPETFVYLTQSLGNSYTLEVNHNLVRIKGSDGDALGLVVQQEPDINEHVGSVEDKVLAQLKTCYDPEIPVNIYDLGLIYQSDVLPLGLNDFRVAITMTLTAPGCGMGPALVAEVEEKIKQINEVKDLTVLLVFDPPWDRSRMSEAALLQLGLL